MFEKLKQDLTGGAVRNSALVTSRIELNVEELRKYSFISLFITSFSYASSVKSKHLESLKPFSMSRANRKLCLPGTRRKLLDNITEQILQPTGDANTPTKNIFWLHGIAGCGKSTIANTIAHQFNRLGRRGAYLFFEKSTGDPTVAIRTLAHQLALFDPTLCTEICRSIRSKPTIIDDSLQDQFDGLVLNPLRRAADKLIGPIVVVLDALDECGDSKSRRNLLDVLLKGLPALPQIVRILITSRAEPDIHLHFSNSVRFTPIELTVAVEKDEATSDIRAFIRSELARITHPKNLSTSWPTKHDLDLLATSSEGLFIWASTVCLQITDAVHPIGKLDELIATSKRGGLKGLDALYATTLQNAFNWGDEGTESQELFRTVMGVIFLYPIPVNLTVIDMMFKLKEGISSQLILNRLRCLFDYSADHPIRPLHASFRDYLTDTFRSGDKPWSLSSVDSEHFISECCLRVMSSQLHFNMYDIRTSYCSDREYFETNTKAILSPELCYACKNWSQHLKSVQTLGQSDPLAKVLSDFGSEQFLFWVEVVSDTYLFKHRASQAACKIAAKVTKVGIFMIGYVMAVSK